MKRIILILVFLSTSSAFLFSQDYNNFHTESLETNKKGMLVLGSWAIGNIVIGAYGWKNNTGTEMYFHQMNLFWNTVNLGIAGIGYFNNIPPDIVDLSNSEILNKHIKSENIYLINAGLDIVYMSGGLLLRKLSETKKRTELLKGYGNSVILQGGFLFVFDLAMYGIQKSHRMNFLENVNISSNGLGLHIGF